MRSGIKIGSGGSFSAIQNELIISDADTRSGGNLTAFSNQTSQGEGGGAGYPNDHHSDEHSNPIADSLSFSGTESHYQIFTSKRISLASLAYVFICSSFARQSPPASLGFVCLSVSLSALLEWSQNPATIILKTSVAAQPLQLCPPAGPRLTIRPLQVRASARPHRYIVILFIICMHAA
eukprot:SAG31_NODE_4690_length_3030_cov_3.710338_1_plen_179_part_00